MATFPRTCEQCGNPFTANRAHARFCSARCRVAWNRARTGELATNAPAVASDALADYLIPETRSEVEELAARVLDGLRALTGYLDPRQAVAVADVLAPLRDALGSAWTPLAGTASEWPASWTSGHSGPLGEIVEGRHEDLSYSATKPRGGRGPRMVPLDEACRAVSEAAADAYTEAARHWRFEQHRAAAAIDRPVEDS